MQSNPSLAPPGRLKTLVFGIYFLVLLLMALFPPLYLSISSSAVIVLGIPLPIFYWIGIATFTGLGLWVLYLIESATGEIPEEGDLQ
jgi:hypothetical protein